MAKENIDVKVGKIETGIEFIKGSLTEIAEGQRSIEQKVSNIENDNKWNKQQSVEHKIKIEKNRDDIKDIRTWKSGLESNFSLVIGTIKLTGLGGSVAIIAAIIKYYIGG